MPFELSTFSIVGFWQLDGQKLIVVKSAQSLHAYSNITCLRNVPFKVGHTFFCVAS